MEITLEQHYDVTYFLVFIILMAWLAVRILADRCLDGYRKLTEEKRRQAYKHLTRYSFTNPEKK